MSADGAAAPTRPAVVGGRRRGTRPATVATECGCGRPYSAMWDRENGTLHVHGVIDQVAARVFHEELVGRLEAAHRVVVDLNDVDLLSAAGVGALVAGMSRAAADGGRLEVLVGAGEVSQRVLTICGLPHRLN